MFYYTKSYVFEIIDGGEGMVMVENYIVGSVSDAERLCWIIERRRTESIQNSQKTILYLSA